MTAYGRILCKRRAGFAGPMATEEAKRLGQRRSEPRGPTGKVYLRQRGDQQRQK